MLFRLLNNGKTSLRNGSHMRALAARHAKVMPAIEPEWTYDKILVSCDGPIATLILNNPDELNALTGSMVDELAEALGRIDGDPNIRAVIIQGAGDAFSAGGSIRELSEIIDEPDLFVRRKNIKTIIGRAHDAILIMRNMSKPIIASVHGRCTGVGLSLLLASDFAIVADNSKFSLTYHLIGTNPDGGSTLTLTRAVGAKRAMEIAMLGNRFTPQQALDWGMVNRVVSLGQLQRETLAMARRLASGPTLAFAKTKSLINNAYSTNLETQLQAEVEAFAASIKTEDCAEGVAAFLGRRKSNFLGR